LARRSRWKLDEDTIRVYNLRAGQDYLAVNGELENDEEYIKLEIIDNDNMKLIFSNDIVLELKRSIDTW
jgi:CelD/BcsL family acetyltransferase involved in cellulose biosynthesis